MPRYNYNRGNRGALARIRGGFRDTSVKGYLSQGAKFVAGYLLDRYGQPILDAAGNRIREGMDNVFYAVKDKIEGNRTISVPKLTFPGYMSTTGRPGRPKAYDTGVVSIGKGMTASKFNFKGKAKPLRGNDVSRFRTFGVHGSTISRTTLFGLQAANDKLMKSTGLGYPGHIDCLTAQNNLFGSTNAINDYFLQLDRLKVTTVYHNMDRVTVRMDLYDIIYKKDNATEDNDGTVMTPTAIWNKALTKVTSGTSQTNSFPDITPYNLPYFNNYFRILKKHTVYLAPGYSHTHTFTSSGHYPYRETRLYQTSLQGLAGLTYNPMVVVKSAPVRDAADQNISLGTPDVIFGTTFQADWSGRANALRLTNIENTFDSTIVTENVRIADDPNIASTDAAGQSNTDTTPDVDP